MSYVLERIETVRKTCDKLAADLCRDVGPKSESCQMVQAQTRTFSPERCTTMMDRYTEVLADLKKMEAANKPLTAAQQKKMVSGDAPSFGPASAKVTVVEFADFQCPFSAKAARVISDVKAKYGSRIRFVFRQFPLKFHTDAHRAAQAALAAHAQGKFWDYHDKLFAVGPSNASNTQKPDLSRATLDSYATQVRLDSARFKKAIDNKEYAGKVDADMKLAVELNVQGTPTLFVNGKRLANATDYETVADAIEAALADSGK